MNNYEITFTQNSPDRNGRIYDQVLYRRMVNQFMQNSLPDELKMLNIEIEEYEE